MALTELFTFAGIALYAEIVVLTYLGYCLYHFILWHDPAAPAAESSGVAKALGGLWGKAKEDVKDHIAANVKDVNTAKALVGVKRTIRGIADNLIAAMETVYQAADAWAEQTNPAAAPANNPLQLFDDNVRQLFARLKQQSRVEEEMEHVIEVAAGGRIPEILITLGIAAGGAAASRHDLVNLLSIRLDNIRTGIRGFSTNNQNWRRAAMTDSRVVGQNHKQSIAILQEIKRLNAD